MLLTFFQVRKAVEKVLTEMNRTDGIYFEQKVPTVDGLEQKRSMRDET